MQREGVMSRSKKPTILIHGEGGGYVLLSGTAGDRIEPTRERCLLLLLITCTQSKGAPLCQWLPWLRFVEFREEVAKIYFEESSAPVDQ